jgi:hypothetical protein
LLDVVRDYAKQYGVYECVIRLLSDGSKDYVAFSPPLSSGRRENLVDTVREWALDTFNVPGDPDSDWRITVILDFATDVVTANLDVREWEEYDTTSAVISELEDYVE